MLIKLKWVVVFEAVLIVILLSALITSYAYNSKIKNPQYNTKGLLSPRVYSGLLEPKSFLISHFALLKENIGQYITKNNLNVSVYVESLRNGVWMGINEKTGFFPASLIKMPVAILITQKIEDGELSFDTMLEIKDEDKTDSSGELYKTKEKELPLRIVLEKMLKESDNTAFRVLLRQIDVEDFQLILDYYSIDVNADFQDEVTAKHQNLLSPKAMSTLFSSLYFSTVLEAENSEYLLSLLTDTVFDANQVANIPDDVVIAHKFGETYYVNYRYFHDCGIMYINESRIVYCIMTKNLDEERAVEAIGAITNEIYHYVIDTKKKIEAYNT
ncbi:serine hydrolase [Candidatus Woesearchaeota archaeon]|nr:serine hydrolase [Candidatus Woesearchaeota archaeon]